MLNNKKADNHYFLKFYSLIRNLGNIHKNKIRMDTICYVPNMCNKQ